MLASLGGVDDPLEVRWQIVYKLKGLPHCRFVEYTTIYQGM
jgi:hypothetical protein